jgi:hypothetical protein
MAGTITFYCEHVGKDEFVNKHNVIPSVDVKLFIFSKV